jgi:1-phosphofructokinase
MILTVTLNPAIDQTIEVEQLKVESLNHVLKTRRDPGGKGINVSRVIHSLGGSTIATGFLAGDAGAYIEKTLSHIGIACNFVQVDGETRTNIKVFDKTRLEITELNEPGPMIEAKDLMELKLKLDLLIKPKSYVVLSGSAPQNLGPQIYADLIRFIKSKDAVVFFDADGALFKEGLKAKPQMIKPNRKELERYFGRSLASDDELLKAARQLTALGIELVFISLGSEGAMAVNAEKAYRLMPLQVDAHSSVGAGDAFVGACVFALERGLDFKDMLKLCVATSAGAVVTEGTNPPTLNWVKSAAAQVKIIQLDEVNE